MTDDIDVDRIEEMLDELSLAAEGKKKKTTSPSTKARETQQQRAKQQQQQQQHQPGGSGLANFSTYDPKAMAQQQEAGGDNDGDDDGDDDNAALRSRTTAKANLPQRLEPLNLRGGDGSGATSAAARGTATEAAPFDRYNNDVLTTGAGGTPIGLSRTAPGSNKVSPSNGATALGGGGARTTKEEPEDLVSLPNFFFNRTVVPVGGGITPQRRWGNTIEAVNNEIYCFGGTSIEENVSGGSGSADYKTSTSNDFFAFNLQRMAWEPVFCSKGRVPPPRFQHTMVSYQSRYLVVYGGTTTQLATHGDVHVFDTLTQEWYAKAPGGKTPTSRFGHTAVMYKSKMYVFGGKCVRSSKDAQQPEANSGGGGAAAAKKGPGAAASYTLSNQLFALDLKKMTWIDVSRKIKRTTSAAASTIESPGKNDDESAGGGGGPGSSVSQPCRRWGHGATLVSGARIVVHGGENTDGQWLSDSWLYSIHQHTWTQVHDGAMSVPRCHHRLLRVGQFALAIGGGATLQETNVPAVSFFDCSPASIASAASNQRNVQWYAARCIGAAIHSSKKDFGACVYHGFVYIIGGASSSEIGGNAIYRFLATPDVHVDTSERAESISGQMSQIWRNATAADIKLELAGNIFDVHTPLLHARAPHFLQDVLKCKADSVTGAYQLEGSSHAKGLACKVMTSHLRHFLEYLYTGHLNLLATENSTVEDTNDELLELATTYNVAHLIELLRMFDAGNRLRASKSSSSAAAAAAAAAAASSATTATAAAPTDDMDAKVTAAEKRGEEMLVQSIEQLIHSGGGDYDYELNPLKADVALDFEDPHTSGKQRRYAHSFVLARGCTVLREVLMPMMPADGKTSNTAHSIGGRKTTKSASHKGRWFQLGPIKASLPAVSSLMEYFYTGSTQIAPEVALSVMMAAHELQLPRLQIMAEVLVASQDVTGDNAIEFLALATRYRAHHLMEYATIAAARCYPQVSTTSQFASLPQSVRDDVARAAVEMGTASSMVTPGSPPPAQTVQKNSNAYAAMGAKTFQ